MAGMIMIFAILAGGVGIVSTGFCLKILWGWFVVPLGVDPIGIAHALGISTLIAMLAKEGRDSSDDDDAATKIIQALLKPWAFLGVGWIIHQFM